MELELLLSRGQLGPLVARTNADQFDPVAATTTTNLLYEKDLPCY